MPENRIGQLLEKANSLPLRPGVYIMKNTSGKVIYVGKSRKLKNRVSQYFQNSQKNIKTQRMVNSVCDFDYILCDTEIEALSLENTLIKQYSPKYNIRLKDAKSYPYIKLTQSEKFPRLVMTRKRENGKDAYFGPYSSSAAVHSAIDMLNKTLGLPSCAKNFDTKGRPCIYRQMRRCLAPCVREVNEAEYAAAVEEAKKILSGKTAEAIASLEERMTELAERERFEEAARCRDSIVALRKISEKQKVVSSPDRDFDLFALYSGQSSSCLSMFCIRSGVLSDKEDFIGGADAIAEESDISSMICSIYDAKEYLPREILIANELESEDIELLSGYFYHKKGKRVEVRIPQRGEMRALCAMAYDNAKEKAQAFDAASEKDDMLLARLASILGLEVLPERIEAYDISNIGRENTVCSMIVAENGKLKKSDYRSFNIGSVSQDDYGAMREALYRRLSHLQDESGSFSNCPDLILLDGGRGHVSVIKELIAGMGLDIPVFGMVKDEHHKTRALCSLDGDISIAREQAVFVFIYKLQEEVHRFAISKSSAQKRKTLKHSSLENVSGIGASKAKALLAHFGSIGAIKQASAEQLASVRGISRSDAENIIAYYNKERI